MAEDSFKPNQSWSQNQDGSRPPLGTGEGESPMTNPLAPKIDMRTMESDISSMKDSGGGAPRPYVPPPPAFIGEVKKEPAPQNKFEPEINFPPAPPTRFNPLSSNFGQPQEIKTPATPLIQKTQKAKSSGKGLFTVILILVLLSGLGAIGYFLIYPKFFAADKSSEEVQVPPPQPIAEVVVPPAPVAEPAPSPIETPPAAAPSSHISFFKSPADLTSDATLSSLNSDSFKTAIEFSATTVKALKEIVFKNSGGENLKFTDIMAGLMPNVFGDLSGAFEEDATFFVYSNSAGAWPGFVAKAKNNGDFVGGLASLKEKVAQLEGDASTQNLFLVNAGSAGTWKSGETSGISNRYASFSSYSLNYGWLNDLLVVSTSYEGFKEAITRLK